MSWLWGGSCPDLARAWPNLGVINHWGLRFQSSALCWACPALPSFSSPFLEHLEGSRDPDLPPFDTTICIWLFETSLALPQPEVRALGPSSCSQHLQPSWPWVPRVLRIPELVLASITEPSPSSPCIPGAVKLQEHPEQDGFASHGEGSHPKRSVRDRSALGRQ